MRYLRVILCILLLAIFCMPVVGVLASDISNALFYGVIAVTNNSTATTNVATVASINTTNLIAGGYLNAGANNTVIRNSSGADIPFMPGYTPDGNPWCIWVPSIGDNSILSYILYTANSTPDDINYFPGILGGNTTDSATLEPAANFTIEQNGFVNTAVTANASLVSKPLGFHSWIAPAGLIRSGIGYSPYLSYDGAGDYCTKAAAVVAPSGAQMSVDAIFRIDVPGGVTQVLVAIGDAGGGIGTHMYFRVLATNQISWRLGDGAGGWASLGTVVNTVSRGEWHAVTFVYDDTATPKMVVYLDGHVASITDAGIGGNIVQPNVFMVVGAKWNGAIYNDQIVGDIDEVRVSDVARTADNHTSLYKGMHTPEDAGTISLWHFNEGAGNPADEKGNNNLIRNGATWSTGAPVIETIIVSAAATSDNYTVRTTANTTDLGLYLDGTLQATIPLGGASVVDTSSNWTFIEDSSMYYLSSQNITIGGTLQQDIVWEYGTVFTDLSGNGHDMNATFRIGSSDPDVSANLTSFLPVSEAQAPDYVLGVAPDFIDPAALTGNVTDNFTITPPAGGFPLAGVIAAVATATSTPSQLPLLLIAGFVIIAASLTVSATIRRYGSGSIIIKIITIVAFMGIFIALANFGIDFWMLVTFLVISVAMAMASRQLGWS